MKRIKDLLFVRVKHTCPWWLCFTFDNYLRKIFQDPQKILLPYVRQGSTVLDIGPGMGYFTIPLLKMVGNSGRVIAVDIQQEMLRRLEKRARKTGLSERIHLQLCSENSLGITTKVDFALAFWMVHEVPDKKLFLRQIALVMKAGSRFLLVEPALHVNASMFEDTIDAACKTGLTLLDRPGISLSRAALFGVKDVERQ